MASFVPEEKTFTDFAQASKSLEIYSDLSIILKAEENLKQKEEIETLQAKKLQDIEDGFAEFIPSEEYQSAVSKLMNQLETAFEDLRVQQDNKNYI